MSLSLEKLETFLSNNGIIISNFYSDKNKKCMYVHVISLSAREPFIIKIPSKYSLKVNEQTNAYILQEYKVDKTGDVVTEYINDEIIKDYEPIEIHKQIGDSSNAESHLEERYNKPLKLPCNNKSPMTIYRQIRRLGLCLSGTPYNICINISDIMYMTSKEHEIKYFKTTDSSKFNDKHRKLLVVVDLDYLFENIDTVTDEVENVKKSIFDITRKNFETNLKTFYGKWVDNSKVKNIYNFVTDKLKNYVYRLKAVNEKLIEISKEESKYLEKKSEITSVNGMKTFISKFAKDTELTRQMRPIDIKLNNINNDKKEIIRNILSLKLKSDHLLLITDDLTFDINVVSEIIQQKINNFDVN